MPVIKVRLNATSNLPQSSVYFPRYQSLVGLTRSWRASYSLNPSSQLCRSPVAFKFIYHSAVSLSQQLSSEKSPTVCIKSSITLNDSLAAPLIKLWFCTIEFLGSDFRICINVSLMSSMINDEQFYQRHEVVSMRSHNNIYIRSLSKQRYIITLSQSPQRNSVNNSYCNKDSNWLLVTTRYDTIYPALCSCIHCLTSSWWAKDTRNSYTVLN